MGDKTRQYKTVYRWLREQLNPEKPGIVDYADRVSKHIGGGGSAIVAFLNTLNNAQNFKSDGLSLLPGDVPIDTANGHPTVRHLMIAILDNYLQREWRIT